MLRKGQRVFLSRETEEMLFQQPEIMSEGSIRDIRNYPVYFGSTMLTIDLQTLMRSWRTPINNETLQNLVGVLEGSVRVKIRAMRIACAEAAHRVPNHHFDTPVVETRIRVHHHQLHIDVDLEVPLRMSREHKHSP